MLPLGRLAPCDATPCPAAADCAEGARVWVAAARLWERAEVVSCAASGAELAVVLSRSGRQLRVPLSAAALHVHAPDSESSSSSSDSSRSRRDGGGDDDDGDEASAAPAAAPETVLFAGWCGRIKIAPAPSSRRQRLSGGCARARRERHTRGVASRMMAAMGFVSGRGLGRQGQGRAVPLMARGSSARLLPCAQTASR